MITLIFSTYWTSVSLVEQTPQEGLMVNWWRSSFTLLSHVELVGTCWGWVKWHRHTTIQRTNGTTPLCLLSCNYSIFIFIQLLSGFQSTDLIFPKYWLYTILFSCRNQRHTIFLIFCFIIFTKTNWTWHLHY